MEKTQSVQKTQGVILLVVLQNPALHLYLKFQHELIPLLVERLMRTLVLCGSVVLALFLISLWHQFVKFVGQRNLKLQKPSMHLGPVNSALWRTALSLINVRHAINGGTHMDHL